MEEKEKMKHTTSGTRKYLKKKIHSENIECVLCLYQEFSALKAVHYVSWWIRINSCWKWLFCFIFLLCCYAILNLRTLSIWLTMHMNFVILYHQVKSIGSVHSFSSWKWCTLFMIHLLIEKDRLIDIKQKLEDLYKVWIILINISAVHEGENSYQEAFVI